MILINNNKKIDELNKIYDNDTYILTDFDGTITEANSDSSWASIFKNPKVTKDFINKCEKIFNYYHKFEIEENIPLDEKMYIMNEWYQKNIETLKIFKITEDIINYAADNENIMSLRKGAKEFLKSMYDKGIPIIIISAGVGNIIEKFLIRNNCNYDNIFILSNFMKYTNGIVSGVENNNLIHSLNKNEVLVPSNVKSKIENRNNVILLGDNISDINMVGDNKNIVIKIGFLDEKVKERLEDFKRNYDIVCTNNTSYDELKQKVKILR